MCTKIDFTIFWKCEPCKQEFLLCLHPCSHFKLSYINCLTVVVYNVNINILYILIYINRHIRTYTYTPNKNIVNGIRDADTITSNFLAWNKANGKAEPGLTRRRNSEVALFLNSDYSGNY